MEPVFWAGLLLAVGLGLAVVEMFVPSGGILGFLCLAAIATAIFLAFFYGDATIGVSFVVAAGIALPTVIVVGFKYWPSTPFGKRLLLSVPTEEEVLPGDRGMKSLVGKLGRAKSVMLPSGPVEIDGKIVDAVSEGMAIEPGQTVKVIEVRANRVVVRPADSHEEQQRKTYASDDVLSRGIDELGLEDPLT